MTHVITMTLSSGSRCQLPFDGTNTDGFKFALIPPAIDDDYPVGEYITYGLDKYVWSGTECVLDYHESALDLRGVILTVGKETIMEDDIVCAANLYIEAANCGRRCNPAERVTMHVFAGAGNNAGRGAPTGPLGGLG